MDVRQLKSSIWQHIETAQDDDSQDAATADSGLTFAETVASLTPKEDSEVTVPFYFICLLHLANEKGLELKGDPNLADFSIATN